MASSGNISGSRPLIEAQNLVRHFGGVRAVDGMSLALPKGAMVGLIGPNGAGKTTFFNLLAGALKPSAGTILIGGRDVSRESPEMRIRRGLGRTFQIPRPFAEMTVLENVLVGGQDQGGERIWTNFFTPGRVRAEEKAAVDKARALLDFVTLAHLEAEPARVLSGGQRKLLELARILMADPQAILLDEPAAGVNPKLLELIIDRVVALNAGGRTVLLIEHNMDMVARLCPHVVVMAAGKLLAEGPPGRIVRDPAVIAAYLGEAASSEAA